MSHKSAFIIEGTVVDTLPRGTFTVEIANGHFLLGHVMLKQQHLVKGLTVGAIVMVKLTPGDLSHGLVIFNESKL